MYYFYLKNLSLLCTDYIVIIYIGNTLNTVIIYIGNILNTKHVVVCTFQHYQVYFLTCTYALLTCDSISALYKTTSTSDEM